ncbi:hypothetical protein L596_015633 [Steinernema carpocapsae]|uniref:Uncharacterized protein n=1 Tax=Steinernema carpocapsae TaxID=34508 RepID=A0A4U5NFJ2_STECR|nr:hypothetical protein L596_015633 [Steinernema carpocapsae]
MDLIPPIFVNSVFRQIPFVPDSPSSIFLELPKLSALIWTQSLQALFAQNGNFKHDYIKKITVAGGSNSWNYSLKLASGVKNLSLKDVSKLQLWRGGLVVFKDRPPKDSEKAISLGDLFQRIVLPFGSSGFSFEINNNAALLGQLLNHVQDLQYPLLELSSLVPEALSELFSTQLRSIFKTQLDFDNFQYLNCYSPFNPLFSQAEILQILLKWLLNPRKLTIEGINSIPDLEEEIHHLLGPETTFDPIKGWYLWLHPREKFVLIYGKPKLGSEWIRAELKLGSKFDDYFKAYDFLKMLFKIVLVLVIVLFPFCIGYKSASLNASFAQYIFLK